MDKVDTAVMRIRAASEMALQYYGTPLVVTSSGGKDSSVCVELARLAGIPFEVQHNHTTADAPETVRFVRSEFERLESLGIPCSVNYPVFKGQRTSMWDLIPKKLMPPTRLVRYCCEVLKEYGGKGRFITTGVRWAESAKRKNARGIYEALPSNRKKNIILNNDNDEKRLLFESCTLRAKRVCNPIIDWTDDDVRDFLRERKVPVNPLYDEGFTRVGCVGCPMAGKARYREFERWPKYRKMYIHAFDRMIAERQKRGLLDGSWRMGTSGTDVFRWWMQENTMPGQLEFDFSDPAGTEGNGAGTEVPPGEMPGGAAREEMKGEKVNE